MAECILMGSTMGGVMSDDVTASKADVLKGKTTITTDSDDEVVEGTIDRKNAYTTAVSSTVGNNQMYIYIPKGAYLDAGGNGNYPEITIPGSDLGDCKSSDVRAGKTYTSTNGKKVTGTSKVFDGTNTSTNYVDVYADESDVRMWGEYAIIRIGQGIMGENTNFVASKQSDIQAKNILEGKTIFGVSGTAKDYSSARVVFNGATFDGLLVSEVASSNRGFSLFAGYVTVRKASASDPYGYMGIENGGLYIRQEGILNSNIYTGDNLAYGFCLGHSVNLTPFTKIKITYRVLYKSDNSASNSTTVRMGAIPVSSATGSVTSGMTSIPITSFRKGCYANSTGHAYNTTTINTDYTLEVDVTSLNDWAYIGIESLHESSSSRSGSNAFRWVVTKIEFLN